MRNSYLMRDVSRSAEKFPGWEMVYLRSPGFSMVEIFLFSINEGDFFFCSDL